MSDDNLTKQWGNNPAVPTKFELDFVFDIDNKTYKGFVEILNKLNAYEQLGTVKELSALVETKNEGLEMLPCKVGDTVWTNICVLGDYFKKKDRPYRCEVVFIGICGKSGYANVVFKNGRMHQFALSDFGKTIFLTREEAETALAN